VKGFGEMTGTPGSAALRWARGFVALALALLPACSGSSAATTTTAAATTTTAAATTTATTTTTVPPATTTTTAPAEMPVFADDGELVAFDDAVTVGRLDNGLIYYVRENAAPGGRVQLRLVVRAGSVNETDEQPGTAHFLEHMMFNGTAAFPANELLAVLQGFGAAFGPEINAYTDYEETVYRLELPTDDPAVLETGLDVLLQWATAATLDPEEIDLERGVLTEEWRLRDQGFQGRYETAVTDLLLAGTPYADRLPLAAPEQVQGITGENLRDFYQTWYRPSLMAVVAVGDIDAATVEGLIRDRFEGLEDPAEAAEAPALFTVPFSTPEILVLADPEAPYSFVELNYPVPAAADAGTVGALRRRLALGAAFTMLETRLREDTLHGSTPFFDSSGASNDFVRTQSTQGVFAFANPADLSDTAEALLTEVERARRFGFSQDELDRAIRDLQAEVTGEYNQQRSKQDAEYASDYVEHFLGGAPAAEAREWRTLRLRLIDELTVEQVGATFAATIGATQPLVIVGGPEAAGQAMPTEAELGEVTASIRATDLEPRESDAAEAGPLMQAPGPVEPVQESTLSGLTIPIVEFENGLRFTYWPTDIYQGHVELLAASPGGWATLDPDDVTEAQLLGDLMSVSGVAGFDQVGLERSLVGTEAFVELYVDEVWEGLTGFAESRDLETLFQLAHLYLSEPRFDPMAVGIVQERLRQPSEAPETLADTALELGLAEARFGGDPRFAPVPSAADLASLDLERAAAVFADRFGDPGDFVFVLVGDFDPAAAEDLAARYLGTLTGGTRGEGFTDARPEAPAEVVTKTVEAGTGERGALVLLFSTEQKISPYDRAYLDILEAVVGGRLMTHIREELSASYSPSVAFEVVDQPHSGVEVTIRVDGDPARLDEVLEAVLADLAGLAADGPTDDELAIAREQVLSDYEMFNDHLIAEALLASVYGSGETLLDLITRIERALAATGGDIRSAARQVFPLEAYIVVRLVPIGFEG
jgi:zinc protease